MSESKLYLKLLKVQGALKAPKSQWNKFGEFNYRSAEDILESVKPLLVEEGLVIQLSDDIDLIGDRYYVKATARLVDVDNGDYTETVGYAREIETKKKLDPSQVTGATSSYARKYALNGLLAIDDSKDMDYLNDENRFSGQQGKQNNYAGNRPQNPPQKPSQKVTLEEAKKELVISGEYEGKTLWEVAEMDLPTVQEWFRRAPRGSRKCEMLKLIIAEKVTEA